MCKKEGYFKEYKDSILGEATESFHLRDFVECSFMEMFRDGVCQLSATLLTKSWLPEFICSLIL